MEQYLIGELMHAMSEGSLIKSFSYLAIFLVLWLEIRGMKNQLKTLNKMFANNFDEGEHRFQAIEARLHEIEMIQKPRGANDGTN